MLNRKAEYGTYREIYRVKHLGISKITCLFEEDRKNGYQTGFYIYAKRERPHASHLASRSI